MNTEMWKPVVGHEGAYEVSSFGRVKSVARRVHCSRGTRGVKERILKPLLKKGTGYLVVCLTRKKQECIHRIVLTAFSGAPDKGQEACHCNGNRADNRLENLRWDTRVNNAADRKLHGTEHVGAKSPAAKLTDDAVRIIRASSKPMLRLAREFGVCAATIKRVISRDTWINVE